MTGRSRSSRSSCRAGVKVWQAVESRGAELPSGSDRSGLQSHRLDACPGRIPGSRACSRRQGLDGVLHRADLPERREVPVQGDDGGSCAARHAAVRCAEREGRGGACGERRRRRTPCALTRGCLTQKLDSKGASHRTTIDSMPDGTFPGDLFCRCRECADSAPAIAPHAGSFRRSRPCYALHHVRLNRRLRCSPSPCISRICRRSAEPRCRQSRRHHQPRRIHGAGARRSGAAAADAAPSGKGGRDGEDHAARQPDGHVGQSHGDHHAASRRRSTASSTTACWCASRACRRGSSRGATRAEMVHAPTLYDVAHARGLTTAQVDWVAIWNAPTVTWEFRERPDPERIRSPARWSPPAS